MIDDTAYIAPGAIVVGNVSLGRQSSVWYNSVIRGDMAAVSIGEQSNIQDLSMVHVDAGVSCLIGDRVTVGHRVVLHGCVVEDECLVGMGAILLDGARLGTGSVVGAGALITEGRHIPPGSLVLGVPARVVRPVDARLRAAIDFGWKHYLTESERHRRGGLALHRGAAPQ